VSSLKIRVIHREDLDRLFDGLIPIRNYAEADRRLVVDDMAWWLFENPSGNGVQAAVYDGDTLAGIAYITPKPFVLDGEPTLLAEIGGTETSKAYQGRGIFSMLVGFLTERANERGYAAIYGTPNEASGRIYLGKLGFTGLFHWDRHLRPIDWGKVTLPVSRLRHLGRGLAEFAERAAHAGARLGGAAWDATLSLAAVSDGASVIPLLDPAVPPLLLNAARGQPVLVQRDAAYLSWRFSRPGRVYRHVLSRDSGGSPRGWATFAITTTGDTRTRAHVGDYAVHPWTRENLRALMQGVFYVARTEGLSEVYVSGRATRGPRLGPLFGYASTKSAMPVIVKSLQGDVERFTNWDYRDSDADMF
jgi:GNAT superfamily N-acetyltransferase